MVLCNVECVERISQYLGVSAGKLRITEDNVIASDDLLGSESVAGFGTVMRALVHLAKKPSMLGKDLRLEILTAQWLEYIVLCVNYADDPGVSRRVLKELNAALKYETYITGTSETIADIALYYALYSIMRAMSIQEKAKYVNVSRWYDNMQQNERLRQKLESVDFNLLHLYL